MVGFNLGEGSGSGFRSLEDGFGSSKSEMGLHYNYPIRSSIKEQIIYVEGQVKILGSRFDFVLQGGCQCSHLYFNH